MPADISLGFALTLSQPTFPAEEKGNFDEWGNA